MGILHFEEGGNPSLHIDGENLWGRVALHFGHHTKKAKDRYIPLVKRNL